ncbi:peptide-methionine (R)-S-oxide reductase MsrB [Arboricoccus pini]
MMTRRVALGAVAAAAIAAEARKTMRPAKAGETFPVTHDDAEWHRLLTPEQYAVLRQSATERPFTSSLLHERRVGVFTCAGCARDLFASATKFDSGTGWPSFWAPLEQAVETKSDDSFGMNRTAVRCHGCGGHLGHVFDDGPKPTGLRYCMNGVAMNFKAEIA